MPQPDTRLHRDAGDSGVFPSGFLASLPRGAAGPGAVVALAGSFFPLHAGHLDVLRMAARHLQQHRGEHVAALVLLPTAQGSLRRKFPGLGSSTASADPRQRFASGLLPLYAEWAAARGELPIYWAPSLIAKSARSGLPHACLLDSPHMGDAGVLKLMLAAREECAAAGLRLVQACGTDNQVRATLRAGSGRAVVVLDARGAPPENAELIDAVEVSGWLARPPGTGRGPAMSSTIERFLAPTGALPEVAVPPALQPAWLTDTGTTLGAGRQACVRLMMLGTLPVAVKLIRRTGDRFDTFDIEAPLWRQLEDSGLQVTPRLYGIGGSGDGRTGYIVTAVGASLTRLAGIRFEYDWAPAGDEEWLEEALGALGVVPGHVASLSSDDDDDDYGSAGELHLLTKCIARRRASATEALVRNVVVPRWSVNGASGGDRDIAFRCTAAEKIRASAGRLRSQGVLHRDLKVDNMLVFPDGTLRFCDLGVAQHPGERRKIARGNIRQYPPRAVQRAKSYDHDADEYMAAMAAYEVLCGHPLFPECGTNIEAAIAASATGVFPPWKPALVRAMAVGGSEPALQARLVDTVRWVESVWAREHPDAPTATNGTAG